MSSTETVPAVTTRTTMVSSTSPMTSSATAAPSTVRASTRVSAPRSLNTRAVIPTLVAASAAPMKSDVLPDSPYAERDAEAHRDRAARRRCVATAQRRLPDGPQVAEAQLEADVEQQQDHAELGEDLERDVVADERRAPTGR